MNVYEPLYLLSKAWRRTCLAHQRLCLNAKVSISTTNCMCFVYIYNFVFSFPHFLYLSVCMDSVQHNRHYTYGFPSVNHKIHVALSIQFFSHIPNQFEDKWKLIQIVVSVLATLVNPKHDFFFQSCISYQYILYSMNRVYVRFVCLLSPICQTHTNMRASLYPETCRQMGKSNQTYTRFMLSKIHKRVSKHIHD